MERIDVLEELVNEFFNNNEPTKENLKKFLIDKQYRIAGDYDRQCHREDVINELADCDYDTAKIPDDLIDNMVDDFEDWLCDYGSETGWRTLLNELIEYFEQDLEEYYMGESDE